MTRVVKIAGRQVSEGLERSLDPDVVSQTVGNGFWRLGPMAKHRVGCSLDRIVLTGLSEGAGASVLGVAREALELSMLVRGGLASEVHLLDFRTSLEECLQNGSPIQEPYVASRVSSAQKPPVEFLAQVEAKMASVRALKVPRTRMHLEWYRDLTDQDFIVRPVTEALDYLIGRGFIANPFDTGSIAVVRKTRDPNSDPKLDDGFFMVFNPPVDEGGRVELGVLPEDRAARKRMPISFEFARRDKRTRLVSVLAHSVEGRKLNLPVRDLINIVPPITPQESGGSEQYPYQKILLTSVDFGGRSLADVVREAHEGRPVGSIKTVGGGHIRVYELRRGQEVRRLGLVLGNNDIIRNVVELVEWPCVQARVGSQAFGIHIEPADVGVPQARTLQTEISATAAEIVQYGGVDLGGYVKTRSEVKRVLSELADAVPPIRVGGAFDRERDQLTFIEESKPLIPLLIRLRHGLSGMDEFRDLGYAGIYRTLNQMAARGRALNLSWGAQSVQHFIQGYREMREQGLLQEELGDLIRRNATLPLTEEVRRQHMLTRWFVETQADSIRGLVEKTAAAVSEKIEKIPASDVVLREMGEAFGELRAVIERSDSTLKTELDAIQAGLTSGKPKVSMTAGFNLGFLALKVEKRVKGEDVPTFRKAFEKLKTAFGRAIGGMKTAAKEETTAADIEAFDRFMTLYQMGQFGA